jgi:hypothetical protein
MKKICITVLILGYNIVLSQTVMPESYSKINFVYEQKSNFLIQDGKVYADTLLLIHTYPKLKFLKVTSPTDERQTVGFLDLQNLTKEDKKTLENNLYHTTHTIKGTYDLKKNKTKLFYTRGNKSLNETFKKYFGGSYNSFVFNVIIDYENKNIQTNYPLTNYIDAFENQLKKIDFVNNEKCRGTFTYRKNTYIGTDWVTLDKKYSNKVAPDIIFANNNFGVARIVSLFDTIDLISVSYE